jgi:fluoride ion exporter CrcB/FEX
MLGLGSMLGNLLGGLLREQQHSFFPIYIGSFVINLLLIFLCSFLQHAQRKKACQTKNTKIVAGV